MASEFSVPSHTIFFDGYLDAVGRHYTDDKRLCALTVAVTPSRILERLSIASTTPVEDMPKAFDRDIAKFLHTDSRNRLVFYLIEYFVWYQQFSDICECERISSRGKISHMSTLLIAYSSITRMRSSSWPIGRTRTTCPELLARQRVRRRLIMDAAFEGAGSVARISDLCAGERKSAARYC
jgi:hypothetical protein